ncbi:MAG TPA: peptidoglycan-binding domain-containing protein [Chthoniobacterales bacterium]|jgi:peptidoglycan hydrolase-like protein with peptidoglycan-binding domain|nr:peptidoglycan-binding domain-containing protein [Chthoniobacterales bacterium]
MNLRIAVFVITGALAVSAQADQQVESAQQALKDEGFYYGEVTGAKDTDTTAAIRRYQIRNGLQITGDLNEETLKALGIDSSGVRSVVKASPTAAPEVSTTPDTSDLREERHANAGPTHPLTGQPFPDQSPDRSASTPPRRDEQPPARPDYGAAAPQTGGNFAGTPFEASPPQVQQNVIASAQNILARQGLYRGVIDGAAGPELEFSLRAYQSRVHLPVTGRLDLETLAALRLLPGGKAPIYVPRRRPSREGPVRGEWIPDR